MESLCRRGRIGRRAAKALERHYAAEAVRQLRPWASDFCRAAGLPDHLRSDVFLDVVAESFHNPGGSRALDADRKSSAQGGVQSVSDLVSRFNRGSDSVADPVAG